MKIAFLTPGLEPGRDGVGDYTRQLAAEFIRQGHPTMMVSLNDALAASVAQGIQEAEGIEVPTLRLPARLGWRERVAAARKALDEFQPDWVSVQFVCFGYHPKGLVNGLAKQISPLWTGRNVHMMFHETWLCKELGWGWKQRLLGAFQLRGIQDFVRVAKPKVVHTSNPLYVWLLNRHGLRASELELFGNVPVRPAGKSEWMTAQLQAAFGPGFRRQDYWLFGFFGTVHPQWPPEPLISRLWALADKAGKKLAFLSIGRIGAPGMEIWREMKNQNCDRMDFAMLGEQPAERISEYLSALDGGLATTPRLTLGKSGTAISMLEHGLPLIVNRDDAQAEGVVPSLVEPLVIMLDDYFERKMTRGVEAGPRGSRRPRVAEQMRRDLEDATR